MLRVAPARLVRHVVPRMRSSRCSSASTVIPRDDGAYARVVERGAGISNAITRALAPPQMPVIEHHPDHAEELDELYEALMAPISERIPSQRERLEWLAQVDTSPEGFFAERVRSVEQYSFLIRCLGVQRKLDQAHRVLDEMIDAGYMPNNATFCALIDACARSADIEAAEEALRRMQKMVLPATAPIFTGIIQAYRNAGVPPEQWAHEMLARMRRAGVTEDAPTHTAIISAFVKARQPDRAWAVYDSMRAVGVRADAVTYTAMMMACCHGDQLEQAQGMFDDMKRMRVEPTLATYNAFINVCAARCRSLVELAKFNKEHKRHLERLALDIDPATPLQLAFAQLGRIQDEGMAADEQTYAALLRACAGAAEVERAQNLLSRMLDADVTPSDAHFHLLLKACVRGQTFKPPGESEGHLQVALAVAPSMTELGLTVTPRTIDLVLECHTRSLRLYRALDVLEELYAYYGHEPTEAAYHSLLRMAFKLKRPLLARELFGAMRLRGYEPTEQQERRTRELDNPPLYVAHPPLKQAAWSRTRGHHVPRLSRATQAKWTRRRKAYVESGRPGRLWVEGSGAQSGPLYLSPRALGLPIQSRVDVAIGDGAVADGAADGRRE